MRMHVAALCAMVAGCMPLTPEQLRVDGYRYERTSSKPSRAAANCIAENIERKETAWRAAVRESAEAGHYQVQWIVHGAGGILAVADVRPAGSGSGITLHTQPGIRSIYDERAEEFLKGC